MKKNFICTLVVIFIVSILTGCSNSIPTIQLNKKNKTSSIKTIVIDPGHSSTEISEKEPIAPNSNHTTLKDNLGSTGKYTNIPEYRTNMLVSLKLKRELTLRGYNVIMTKSKVSEFKSNIERASIANKNNADLVIKIHTAYSNSISLYGASMHIPANNQYTSKIYKVSKSYGQTILDTYSSELGILSKGLIERSDFSGFNYSKVPVVLIEMGFLSNRTDDKFISNTRNHNQIAKALADGIDKCF